MTNFIGVERMGNLRNLTKKFTPTGDKIFYSRTIATKRWQ